MPPLSQAAARPAFPPGLGTALLWTVSVAAAVIAVSAIIVGFFDTFWWPPDEGAYAYVAQRLLRGDVLNRDIQDIHAGYVNFANAAALSLFGESLLSLRYPLAIMAWVQAAMVFWMFRRDGAAVAAAAAIALTALSTVQFLDPSAHWYGLFLAVATAFVLAEVDREARGRVELIGFLLVTTFLFRQLTGVFLSIGAVTWLLMEGTSRSDARSAAGVFVAVLMALGIVVYLAMAMQPTNIVLFGAAPVALLVTLCGTVDVDGRRFTTLLGRLMLGGALAAAPLLAYHLANGSLAGWFDDVVVAAASQTELDFIRRPVHLLILSQCVAALAALDSVDAVVNALFWIALLLLPALNGLLILRALRDPDATLHPLPVIAVFYALVSVHNQIPIYLWFSSGLSLVAFLWLAAQGSPRQKAVMVTVVMAAVSVAMFWQAAQPATRGLAGTLRGERADGQTSAGFARLGLRVAADDVRLYADLVDMITAEVPPEGTILALPNNPELYFLANRPAAVRFWNAAFGLRRQADVDALLADWAAHPPRLVFHAPEDKYNTALSDQVMNIVRERYDLVGKKAGLLIYRLALPGKRAAKQE